MRATYSASTFGIHEKGIFKSPGKIYPSLALTDSDLAWTKEAIDHAATRVLAA